MKLFEAQQGSAAEFDKAGAEFLGPQKGFQEVERWEGDVCESLFFFGFGRWMKVEMFGLLNFCLLFGSLEMFLFYTMFWLFWSASVLRVASILISS